MQYNLQSVHVPVWKTIDHYLLHNSFSSGTSLEFMRMAGITIIFVDHSLQKKHVSLHASDDIAMLWEPYIFLLVAVC